MSGSYYTSTRDIFVGGLCALGIFLVVYRFNKFHDILGTVAGVFALGVALFPTAPGSGGDTGQQTVSVFHQVFAIGLLTAMAAFCLFMYGAPGIKERSYVRRPYLVAGVLILVFMALAAAAAATKVGDDWLITPCTCASGSPCGPSASPGRARPCPSPRTSTACPGPARSSAPPSGGCGLLAACWAGEDTLALTTPGPVGDRRAGLRSGCR